MTARGRPEDRGQSDARGDPGDRGWPVGQQIGFSVMLAGILSMFVGSFLIMRVFWYSLFDCAFGRGCVGEVDWTMDGGTLLGVVLLMVGALVVMLVTRRGE